MSRFQVSLFVLSVPPLFYVCTVCANYESCKLLCCDILPAFKDIATVIEPQECTRKAGALKARKQFFISGTISTYYATKYIMSIICLWVTEDYHFCQGWEEKERENIGQDKRSAITDFSKATKATKKRR